MVTKEVRLAKVNYYESVDTCDSKNFWKAYKAACKENGCIPVLVDGVSEQEADFLNHFFSTC